MNALYIWGNDLTGEISFLCDINEFEYDAGDHGSACASFKNQKNTIAQLHNDLNQDIKLIDPECDWEGITCNGNGAIVEINLGDKSLDGSISTIIGQLSELKRIDLSNNSLMGTIPSEIVSLVFLESVNLSKNDLSGDAFFLCGTHFEVVVDDDKVRTCTPEPSPTPSTTPSDKKSSLPSFTPSPTYNPSTSISPSSSLWSQVGDDVEGVGENEEMGESVALSEDGRRLWAGGDGRLRLYKRGGGAWEIELDFSSSFISYVYSISVSISGKVFAAGERSFDSDRGKVIVFREGQSDWAQEGSILTGENYDDWFGVSVSLNGDGTVLAVGAGKGEYFEIFTHNGTDWALDEKELGKDSYFGYSVCLSADGTRMIVGAAYASNNGYRSGSVYLYSMSPFEEFQGMDGDGSYDYFGSRVSMSRDGFVVAAGAYGGDYVKVLEATNSSLQQYQQVGTRMEGPADSEFGYAVSLSADGGRLVIGAPMHDSGRGKAYVYAPDDDGHRLVGEFLGESERARQADWFGYSTATSGKGRTVAVGGPYNSAGIYRSGHVRAYEK